MDNFDSYICHASVECCMDKGEEMDMRHFYIVERNVYSRRAKEIGMDVGGMI